jgi:hypothetical protein
LHRLSKKETVQTDFQVMHDCYFVAPLQPTRAELLRDYGPVGTHFADAYETLYAPEAQAHQQIQARSSLRQTIIQLFQALQKYHHDNPGDVPGIPLHPPNRSIRPAYVNFCNAYALYTLVTSFYGVRLSHLMYAMYSNSYSPPLWHQQCGFAIGARGLDPQTTTLPNKLKIPGDQTHNSTFLTRPPHEPAVPESTLGHYNSDHGRLRRVDAVNANAPFSPYLASEQDVDDTGRNYVGFIYQPTSGPRHSLRSLL